MALINKFNSLSPDSDNSKDNKKKVEKDDWNVPLP